jgi:hypothetical protein
MLLSCCGFLVDWEGEGLVAVYCPLLLQGLVGLVEGLVAQPAVMLTLRMKLWWVDVVWRGLEGFGEGLVLEGLVLMPLE